MSNDTNKLSLRERIVLRLLLTAAAYIGGTDIRYKDEYKALLGDLQE